MRTVERALGGGAELSQKYEKCGEANGWKNRASPEGEALGGWEGEVEEQLWVGGWVGVGGSMRSFGIWP